MKNIVLCIFCMLIMITSLAGCNQSKTVSSPESTPETSQNAPLPTPVADGYQVGKPETPTPYESGESQISIQTIYDDGSGVRVYEIDSDEFDIQIYDSSDAGYEKTLHVFLKNIEEGQELDEVLYNKKLAQWVEHHNISIDIKEYKIIYIKKVSEEGYDDC